ncbi:MAG TPA: tetratricopeptide repeat protein [Herpetosiphonaceae bacterium]
MARFPKGTVTFFCARIHQPGGGRRADLLRKAITSQGGSVFTDSGGEIYGAFSATPPALQAAVQALRHIYAGADSGRHRTGVTIALHSGRVQERNGVYFGPTYTRALSILAAGHPGQILLSASAHESLENQAPPELSISDLGHFRLKDLYRTEQLFQAAAPWGPAGFPPLNTLDIRPHNLPIQPTPLIGRDQEVREICAALGQTETRMLTLLGASGTGKTRLALQVAVELIDEFADGVYFVALAPVTDPALLVSTIAHVLGVKEQGGQALSQTLGEALASKKLLLVLDNFEQLIEAAAALQLLIEAAAGLKLLVTSQTPLELPAEHIFAVPPLAMPAAGQRLPLDALAQIPAVALFVERAREAQPTFALTELIAPSVIELCNRLEGLPLAIELVAAQSKRYFPGDMLVMLQNRLSVARAIRRGNSREDTLRPVLDWICELLGVGAAGLFARLGIFEGGCTLESARAICNPMNDLALDVGDTLALLQANHLLLREELKEGQVRFAMLDAIHEYARQRLTKRREIQRLQSAHAAYYAALAEEAEPLLRTAEQQRWLDRLEGEHHNLRAALGWSSANAPELAGRLGAALARFWFVHGHLTEGRQWITGALAHELSIGPALRARLLHGLGLLAFGQGDYEPASEAYQTSLALRRELDDQRGVSAMLNNLGIIASLRGEYERATAYYEECIPIYRQIGDQWGLANTLSNLGELSLDEARFARAEEYYAEGIAMREQLGDTWGMAISLNNLGRLAFYQGQHAQARDLLGRALPMAHEIDDPSLIAEVLETLGRLDLAHDPAAAQRLLTESLRLRHQHADKFGMIRGLEAFAQLLAATGQGGQAASLLGTAAALRATIGAATSPLDQMLTDATRESALSQIDQPGYEAAWQGGRELPLNQVLEPLLG